MRGQSGTTDTAGLPYSCPGKFLAGAGEEAAGGQVEEELQSSGRWFATAQLQKDVVGRLSSGMTLNNSSD